LDLRGASFSLLPAAGDNGTYSLARVRAAFQVVIGTVCHVDLTPLVPPGSVASNLAGNTDTLLLIAAGPIQPGPCAPAATDNCVQFTFTGSFMVQGIVGVLAGLLPGDVPIVRIPVVNPAGVSQGVREVQCSAAGADGRAICGTAVTDPGVFVPVGGIVEVLVRRPVTATPPPALALRPPVPLLPPPLLLPPPGPPAPPPVPPPLVPREGAAFPEIPVIPEASSLLLFLAGGLVALGGLLAYRRLRRSDR
jgi:hypothetical protein